MSEVETAPAEALHTCTEPLNTPTDGTTQGSKVQKRPRTEAQIHALQKAREQAMIVRQQNAELKRKQQEIDRATLAKAKRDERQRIEREYDALHSKVEEDHTDEPQSRSEEGKPRKRKPARKVIVTEASSGSETDEEVEVVLPRAKKAMTAEQIRYQRAYSKMFEYR
jgi:hypothetical protein